MNGWVRVFAPATVGNVVCGFDVLGLALTDPGDEVLARRTDRPGVRIVTITGDEGRLPTDPASNAASAAAAAVLQGSGEGGGLDLEIHKGLPIASGMGGSAASAVAGAVAAAALVAPDSAPDRLLACALEGERAAVGAVHADNAAPCLLGGIVLVLPGDPFEMVALPVPAGAAVALVHPPLEMKTAAGRLALPAAVPLTDAIAQWADTAAFVAGLYEEDWARVGRAMVDRVAEPVRHEGVPGFQQAREAAWRAGAVGGGLSGSGPSIFALCPSVAVAEAAGRAMAAVLEDHGLIGSRVHTGPVARKGARILERGVTA